MRFKFKWASDDINEMKDFCNFLTQQVFILHIIDKKNK